MNNGKNTATLTSQHTLPGDWRWVKLGEVCEIIMGQSPPGDTYTDKPEGLPFFQGKTDFGEYFPRVRVWCRQPKKIAEERDILITVRAPVGPVNMSNLKCCIGRGLAGIRCKENMAINWFIFWYLRFIENKITSLGNGSTFGAITRSDLENLEVPLPPIDEQRRIAAKIKELMQEVNNLKSAVSSQLEAVKALPASYLREAFESEEAKKWEKKKLGEVCEVVTGSTPKTDDSTNWNGGIFWATPNDMSKLSSYTIGDTSRKISEKGFRSCSTKLLPTGSVLLTTRAPIGHLAINIRPMCTNQGFKSFIVSSRVHNWFLFFTLKYFIPILKSIGRGQTFTEISKRQVANFKIPLPFLEVQRRIASELKQKMAEVEKLQRDIEKQLEAVSALSQSILRKAFRGEI